MRFTKHHLFLLGFLGLFLVNIACSNKSDRKIKIAEGDISNQRGPTTTANVLQVSQQEQHRIAIFNFLNATGDASRDWLKRGLTEILITDFSQSPYLEVIPTRHLLDLARQQKITTREIVDPQKACQIARSALADRVIIGQFYENKKDFIIEVEIWDPVQSRKLYREKVQGEGLEQIFTMVGNLSTRLRQRLKEDFGNIQAEKERFAQLTTSVEAYRLYTQAFEKNENFLFVEAENQLEKALELDSTFAAAYLLLMKIKQSLGKGNEARELMTQIEKFQSKLPPKDQLRFKIMKTIQKREYPRLINLLEEAVALYPYDPDFRLDLARLYRNIGNTNRALEEFNIVLELDPERFIVYNELGYLFAGRGDFNTALSYIEKYQQAAPEGPNPYDSKGEILIWAGRFPEAIKALQTALKKWPDFGYSAYRLANLYAEMGNLKQAVYYAQKLLENSSSPTFKLWAYQAQAEIYWRFGKIKQAEKYFSRVLESNPPPLFSVILAGEMYKSFGDTTKATRIYQQALKKVARFLKEEKGQNARLQDELVLFLLESNLPLKQKIDFLEQLFQKEKNPLNRTNYAFALAILYGRNQDEAQGSEYISREYSQLMDLLVKFQVGGWGNRWKYVHESLDVSASTLRKVERFARELEKRARKAGLKNLEVQANFSRTRVLARSGQFDRVRALYRQTGTPPENLWRISGPYEIRNASIFHHPFPPEKTNALTRVTWFTPRDNVYDGYLNLKSSFRQAYWRAAYAVIFLYSPDRKEAQIRVGADDGCKVWFNDELIWQHYNTKSAMLDGDVITVVLNPGYNKLLLKITNTILDWGFYLRVTDAQGNGLSDITFHSLEEMRQNHRLKLFSAR